MRSYILLYALLCCAIARGQSGADDRELRIGLFNEGAPAQVLVMSERGTCTVYANGVRKGELAANDGLRMRVIDGRLSAKSLSLAFIANRIEVVPHDGGLRMRDPAVQYAERTYPGVLEVSVQSGHMLLVDRVPLEAYTAGVVSAEAGREHHLEYYKLQSVSCRTYALTNQGKHKLDGFELCDGVHCQVFHGRNRNDSIRMAVDATRGLVIVDAEIKLIHATFHSNCGGETLNAEDLWSKREPYLRSTVDTFCLHAHHARWEKTLTRTEWLGYLDRKYGVKATNTAAVAAMLNYEPTCRELYLGNTWPQVPLKNVREDLRLKSTWFSVHEAGDKVVLKGRGFGHAVGLCQEGAMAMARAHISYTDILHQYYRDVHLVDLSTLDFFREEMPAEVGNGGGPRGK